MTARRAEALVVAALAGLALAAAFVTRTYPNYDAYYHLVWGRELVHGIKPDFQAYSAPTEHPLYIAICAVLGVVFGQHADRALVVLCALSLVVLAWGVYRVGRACFSAGAGIVAALFTGSSFALLLFAARAYVDVPFLALVFVAAFMEAERPRRGRSVMAVLLVAGLLRPEAWVLSGFYWLWCGPLAPARERGARLDLLVLAVAAPLAWAGVDAWDTGDPLYSLHATSDLADELNRTRGVGAIPGSFVSFLSSTVRPPVAALAVAGAFLAWRLREGRALHVPIALFLSGAITFFATGVAGLSVLPRYLTVPAVALTIPAGFALTGFARVPEGPLRVWWRRGLAAAVILGAIFVAIKAPVVGRLRAELRFIRGTHDALVAIFRVPAVQRARACGPVTWPNYRLVPDTRWLLHATGKQVGARSHKRHAHGVALFFVDRKTLQEFGFSAGTSTTTNAPDPGFVRIAYNTRYAAYASC
ncbi:MAG TPA: hypothetical protein VFT42_10840 [Solirubrobacteraceae bacterium]|nr:hypothetical protein [Solirubrobacteraceae bacterium]